MSEVKPAVGITPKYINDQPYIVVAFFTDDPVIQQGKKDDNGRPMTVAVFEPEAAYVTFAKQIQEARESLRRMSGVTDYVTPYLSIATLCDNVLHESDDVVSLIRLVDVFQYTDTGNASPGSLMGLLIRGLLQFRGGPETFGIHINILGPNNEHLVSSEATVALTGGSHSVSIKIELAVPVLGEGMYRLVVSRGEEQLRVLPFQIKRTPHVQSPSSPSTQS